ncbi:MAG TPA: hypothetical protein RMH85_25700 [Polyangiaceae bacterium LLY-WYZ-15_(1-7)]|nr:hypothetical protein [Polyangiaceae bacterium LLY-WYZ-15_(1-7)]HJL02111.1 hypothetical protein [Polyangiaceae bacterium LLY-WYZ-15_(1-7)]HJL11897.1 hypothetical protein [Polyangiaceae bacterium LLY-WYZ-15_(1-7)]HJL22496.1 hypothetical protein [Polyangiaceae bacterium LLY-WYZ-15_(1-7)]HJL29071.1 hypothetical protein [Polyangiaceae bacterium LLY-WYZ-15_(1-7)]
MTSSEGARHTLRVEERQPAFDLGVWAVVVLLLGGGLAYARSTSPGPRTVNAFEGDVSFRLPGGWSAHEDEERFVAQRPSLGELAPTVEVVSMETPEAGADALWHDLAITRLQEERASSGAGYRVLHMEEREAFGGQSTWIWYALVRDPPSVEPGAAVLPVVVVGTDVLVTQESGRAWHVAAFEPAHGDDDEGELRSVVEGLRISP